MTNEEVYAEVGLIYLDFLETLVRRHEMWEDVAPEDKARLSCLYRVGFCAGYGCDDLEGKLIEGFMREEREYRQHIAELTMEGTRDLGDGLPWSYNK